MGETRKRLGDIATYFDKEQLAVRCQLEYVGEAIESEIDKVRQMVDRNVKRANGYLVRFDEIESRIEALEKFEKQIGALIDLESFRERLQSLKIEKPVPTNKDKPKFMVGDTIAFYDGDLRIVLEVEQNSMRLMNVPDGRIQTGAPPEKYKLVYRPKFPREV